MAWPSKDIKTSSRRSCSAAADVALTWRSNTPVYAKGGGGGGGAGTTVNMATLRHRLQHITDQEYASWHRTLLLWRHAVRTAKCLTLHALPTHAQCREACKRATGDIVSQKVVHNGGGDDEAHVLHIASRQSLERNAHTLSAAIEDGPWMQPWPR
jgi:hypothetical protein